MSKREMQEGKQGGEDERVVVKSSQPRESQSKWFNFGFIKYGETCRDGFE